MITAWRLCQRRWLAEAFTGQGAARNPGRWNPRGLPAVYLAENRSLAALEVLVHAEDRSLLTAVAWVLIPVRIDPQWVHVPAKYPPGWPTIPAPEATRQFGGDWLRAARQPVLRVPSAVIAGESNYLLNPQSADFRHLDIGKPEPFRFDLRLG